MLFFCLYFQELGHIITTSFYTRQWTALPILLKLIKEMIKSKFGMIQLSAHRNRFVKGLAHIVLSDKFEKTCKEQSVDSQKIKNELFEAFDSMSSDKILKSALKY